MNDEIDQHLDRPEESGFADVTLVTRGVTVTASVELSETSVVIVRPQGDQSACGLQPGETVELYWVGGHEERTLPGTLTSLEGGAEPRWQIAVKGQAERSQRRKAVRARVAVPVIVPWAGSQMTGTTVDLSEGGMRALMDGWGLPPEPGTPTQLSIEIDDDLLHLQGEFVWTADRGGQQWLLAMKFLDVPERAGDIIRRRVFQALRDERAATAG
ncbi:PilZ domain-containing protein [Blastococcus sp. PRF04-17]|uniref:PilZ domain-containing protein n=1 Tax=Blastococcus sp. PRF04-17 TaxID=2933797 RepID=UPI001FF313F5|nr:PilZ domain-containing protein [Blastococcus sp. PRF04-17]UOY03871.1 PilZ domain-containing protein [Blastococcus sp. PRF04-17]